MLPPNGPIEAPFPTNPWSPRIWARALRTKHWIKNLLIFVAPVLQLPMLSSELVAKGLLLFLLMGALASGTYIINDLFDLNADRQHISKRFRPFASGQLPIRYGAPIAVALIILALVASLTLSSAITLSLMGYVVISLAYSIILKRQPFLDVLVLAGLFTLRIFAGSLLLPVPVSPWLLTFSMMFFLGLAEVKRYAELDRVVRLGGVGIQSRGYIKDDLPLLLASGVGSGLSAVVIFIIYLITEHYPREVYQYPEALWLMMPILLMWILRVWHVTSRGCMDEDPLMFTIKDRTSLVLGALIGLALIIAW